VSTNYYWLKEPPPKLLELWKKQTDEEQKNDMNPLIHIGHTAAAGCYCNHCGTTFCLGGSRYVHTGPPKYHDSNGDLKPEYRGKISWENMHSFIEDRNKTVLKACPICGRTTDDEEVIYAYSFSITLDEHYRYLRELLDKGYGDRPLVINEYDEAITVKEMLDTIDGAKYHYQNPGRWS